MSEIKLRNIKGGIRYRIKDTTTNVRLLIFGEVKIGKVLHKVEDLTEEQLNTIVVVHRVIPRHIAG